MSVVVFDFVRGITPASWDTQKCGRNLAKRKRKGREEKRNRKQEGKKYKLNSISLFAL